MAPRSADGVVLSELSTLNTTSPNTPLNKVVPPLPLCVETPVLTEVRRFFSFTVTGPASAASMAADSASTSSSVGEESGALAVAIVIIGAIAYRMRRPRADTALTLGGETKPEAEKETFVLEPTSQI